MINELRAIACVLALVAGTTPAQAPAVQAPAALDPARFEAELKKFDDADRATPPPADAVVFTGSSSIRLWTTLAQDFPGVKTLNRGFGGSELEDVTRNLERVVLRYRPATVVLYSGDNDLNGGKSPARVVEDYRTFVAAVHAALPRTRVIILSIKPSLARWAIADKMRETNAMVQKLVASDPQRLAYVDVFTPMLAGDGTPRPELYVADGLHMTSAGYEIWKKALAPVLR